MLILPKLQAPPVPLLVNDPVKSIEQINSYLQSLLAYFYSCNEEVIGSPTTQNLTASVGPLTWPDGVVTAHSYLLHLDQTYKGGDITITLARRALIVAATTAVMAASAHRFRDGIAFATVFSELINFTPGDNFTHYTTLTIPSTVGLLPGDIIRIDIARNGTDVGDTFASAVANDGLSVSYI